MCDSSRFMSRLANLVWCAFETWYSYNSIYRKGQETHLHRVVSVCYLVLDNVLRRPRVLEAHELHEFVFHVLFPAERILATRSSERGKPANGTKQSFRFRACAIDRTNLFVGLS